MSETLIFAIKDKTSGMIGGPPFVEKHAGPAIRSFNGLLANRETLPGKYPKDFDLLLLGTYNDNTGEITPETPPLTIATGAQWVEAQEQRELPFPPQKPIDTKPNKRRNR